MLGTHACMQGSMHSCGRHCGGKNGCCVQAVIRHSTPLLPQLSLQLAASAAACLPVSRRPGGQGAVLAQAAQQSERACARPTYRNGIPALLSPSQSAPVQIVPPTGDGGGGEWWEPRNAAHCMERHADHAHTASMCRPVRRACNAAHSPIIFFNKTTFTQAIERAFPGAGRGATAA